MHYDYDEFERNFWNEIRVGALMHQGKLVKDVYDKFQLREKMGSYLPDLPHTIVDRMFWTIAKPGQRIIKYLDLYHKRLINRVFPYQGTTSGSSRPLDDDLDDLAHGLIINSAVEARCRHTHGDYIVDMVLNARNPRKASAPIKPQVTPTETIRPGNLEELIDKGVKNFQIDPIEPTTAHKQSAPTKKAVRPPTTCKESTMKSGRNIFSEFAQDILDMGNTYNFDPKKLLEGVAGVASNACVHNHPEPQEPVETPTPRETTHDATKGLTEQIDELLLGVEFDSAQYCHACNQPLPTTRGERTSLNNRLRRHDTLHAVYDLYGRQKDNVYDGHRYPVFRKEIDKPATILDAIPDYNRSKKVLITSE